MVNTASDTSSARSRGVQSVDIAIRLLQIIAAAPGPMSLKAVSDAAGMPASKAHRYLASFVAAGFVTQKHRSGAYDLGRAALQLGLASMARLDIVNDAALVMEDLVEKSGATALLAVWGNRGPIIVRWERGPNFVVTALGLGTIMPLMNSATGQAFLAWLPERMTEPVLAEQTGPDGPPARADVRRLIEDVRERGHAQVDGRFIPGLCAVSAPILNWQHEIEAAISLIGTDPKLIDPAAGLIAELRASCDALSAKAIAPE